jgi:hypothetical protein
MKFEMIHVLACHIYVCVHTFISLFLTHNLPYTLRAALVRNRFVFAKRVPTEPVAHHSHGTRPGLLVIS